MRFSILTTISLCLAAALAAQQAPASCTVQGTAVNHVSGEPLQRVNLQLHSTRSEGVRPYASVSAAEGRFTFAGVDPGQYMLRAERLGFDRYESSFTTDCGQLRGSVAIKLVPQGVVTGRVTDEFGDPLPGVSVEAMQRAYINGTRHVIPASQAVTNDLGEYRLHSLSPGPYFIQAVIEDKGDSSTSSVLLPAYFPNTDRPELAQSLQVAPAQVQSGINFLLRRVPAFSIRGRLALTPRDGNGVMIYLAQRNVGNWLTGRRPIPVDNGAFELNAVPAGPYQLIAEQFGESGAPVAGARIPVDVADRDIDGINLAPTPRPDIVGQLTWEEAPPQPTQGKAPRIVLRPEPGETSLPGSAPIGADVEESGSFRIRSSPPGVYVVLAANLPPEFYVASARLGEAGNPSLRLDLSQSQGGSLTVVVSNRSGTLEGTVEGNRPGLQVFAIAEGNPWWSKAAVTGEQGHFEIKGLAPGEYRVLAFEQIDPLAYQDAELMKSLESKSQRVTLREKDKQVLTLKPIPPDAGGM
jgi:protocatechuate 3,4-dioxygenase beta subunit